MKIPLSWLKEFVDLNLSSSQIAKVLTGLGLEVDAVEKVSLGCENVVIGKVLDVKKHPQADKLCLPTVTDGKETYHLVCGAPNCRVGMKTAFAPVGATVLDDTGKPFKIKKAKIRGEESAGMLCSPKELGLSEESDGIVEFSDHLKEGTDVAELYADVLFEISLTPNLGHCNSVLGVARELSAATEVPLQFPEIVVNEDKALPASRMASVDILNSDGCPRYACRIIKNVQIGPSPEWLKKRVEACGIRSINNIVDVTNYVMLEMGHPLHAFDLDLLAGSRIKVRNATKGELFATLDSKERLLEENDLLICDQDKPVALAGIMGGSNSEVNDRTKNLLIEAAVFAPGLIRKTSKRLGLATDASKRFERGCDPNILAAALNRAAQLIQQVSGGQVCDGIIDCAAKEFHRKRINCRLQRINDLLGTRLSVGEVENIFRRLDLQCKWNGLEAFIVDVPTYRNDLQEEIDLIEEVARLYGYGNIQSGSCRCTPSTLPHAPIFVFERELRSRLIDEGLQEFLTCDLIGPSLLNIIQDTEMPEKLWVKVLNPTSIEQSILRTSLLPGLLQVAKYNWDHQNHDIGGFEIGRIHFKEGENYKEQSVAGIVLMGKSRPQHWDVKAPNYDFFDLKGIVENLLGELKVSHVTFKNTQLKSLHPGRQASIFAGDLKIGAMGEVHPAVLRRLDVPQRILFAEINLHDLFGVKASTPRMQEIPLYPGSERDWTVTLSDKLPIADVFTAIEKEGSTLLEHSLLLDVYRSEKVGNGLQNVTFRFIYRDREKTISQETVDAEHMRITTNVMKSLTNAG